VYDFTSASLDVVVVVGLGFYLNIARSAFFQSRYREKRFGSVCSVGRARRAYAADNAIAN